jgi:hypothetical protein
MSTRVRVSDENFPENFKSENFLWKIFHLTSLLLSGDDPKAMLEGAKATGGVTQAREVRG